MLIFHLPCSSDMFVAALLVPNSRPTDLASQLQREEEEVQRLLQQLRCTLKAAALQNTVTGGAAGTDACGAGGVPGAEPGAEEAAEEEEAGLEDGEPEMPSEEAEAKLQVSWSGQGLALDIAFVRLLPPLHL